MSEPAPLISPLSPLKFAPFRSLWLMWLLTNICLWMWSVAAAWMMVELRVAPVWVALVQAATFMPLLLLGLPFGAIADMVDRRRLLLIVQVTFGAIALIQVGLILAGTASPLAVLATTFAFGCGIAMRNPSYHATIPELVPRTHLTAALSMNAISMNVSRILGPLLTGMIIVFAGPPAVFLIVAAVSVVSFLLVRSWKPAERSSERRPASFVESLKGGVAFVFKSRPLQSNMLRSVAFCGTVTALPALLPLIALDLEGGSASTFSLLFAAMGFGAVASMAFMQRLRARYGDARLVFGAAVIQALSMAALVMSRSQGVAIAAMLVAGISWVVGANTLTIASQLILPDHVRARGMAVHQMALMGSIAVGSALWGQVATLTNIHMSLAIAAVCAPLAVAAAMYWMPYEPARE